jgi:hypothetical protein
VAGAGIRRLPQSAINDGLIINTTTHEEGCNVSVGASRFAGGIPPDAVVRDVNAVRLTSWTQPPPSRGGHALDGRGVAAAGPAILYPCQ